jgi:hypothetical protein
MDGLIDADPISARKEMGRKNREQIKEAIMRMDGWNKVRSARRVDDLYTYPLRR